MSNSELHEETLKAGTIIHLNGIPFSLKEQTVIIGTKINFELAQEFENKKYE